MTLVYREGNVKTVKVPNVREATLQKLAKPIVDRSANIVTDATFLAKVSISTSTATIRAITAKRTYAVSSLTRPLQKAMTAY